MSALDCVRGSTHCLEEVQRSESVEVKVQLLHDEQFHALNVLHMTAADIVADQDMQQ